MLIVEDILASVYPMTMEAKAQKWDCINYGLRLPVDTDELHRYLLEICKTRPDIVVIDIALNPEEAIKIDDAAVEGTQVPEEMFSGFKYCQALANEHWNIPIVILTRSESANLTRAALKAGANRVLIKREHPDNLIMEMTKLVRSKAAHDPIFFWQLCDTLSACPSMWHSNIIEQALNRFFLNQSIIRRFGLFTASLRGILSPLFQGDMEAEKKLMLGLAKSQVLLSLVDPQLRDHVKHTGNVFWMGYRLLHDIHDFEQPQSLSGYLTGLYDQNGLLTPRDQLLYAWTLAALFHDFGYIDERQDQLIGLVKSLLPNIKIENTGVRDEDSWDQNIPKLLEFVEQIAGRTHFLFNFINTVYASFGSKRKRIDSKVSKTTALIDHGFLSAHRLLDTIPFKQLDTQKRNIVLHAALAIACHHHTEILRKWKFESNCSGHLSIGTFPVCSLLSFCDSIQTWDREPEVDPVITQTEAYNDLLERLIISDTAYISGSEICEFSTIRREDNNGYDLRLRLRYFVEAAGGVQEVCEKLGDDIQGWIDSNRLKDVCEIMGITPLLHGQIAYELPMHSKPHEVQF